MAFRASTLYVVIAGLIVSVASIAAYAYSSFEQKPKSLEPKNELVFNWVSTS
jgi:hypothetical protein